MSRLSASLEERRKKERKKKMEPKPTLQLQGVPAKPAGWRLVEVQNGRNSVRRKFVQNSWMVFWRFVKIHCLLPCPPAETISDTHCLISRSCSSLPFHWTSSDSILLFKYQICSRVEEFNCLLDAYYYHVQPHVAAFLCKWLVSHQRPVGTPRLYSAMTGF